MKNDPSLLKRASPVSEHRHYPRQTAEDHSTHLLLPKKKKKRVANRDLSVYIPQFRAFLTIDHHHLQLYCHHNCHHHQHHPHQYNDPGQEQAKAEVEAGVSIMSRLSLLKRTMKTLLRSQLYHHVLDFRSTGPPHTSNQAMAMTTIIRTINAQNRTMEVWQCL